MSHYIKHIAGDFDTETNMQICTFCGAKIYDANNFFMISGDDPPKGYSPGPVYLDDRSSTKHIDYKPRRKMETLNDDPFEYKPITIEDIKKVSDHMRRFAGPPIEPIYLTKEEWEAICIQIKPMQMTDPIAFHGHPVRIVSAEQKEAQMILKELKRMSEDGMD